MDLNKAISKQSHVIKNLINKWKNPCLKCFNDSNYFIGQSNDTQDIYKVIKEYNLNIVFDYMNAGMLHNKKLNLIITELSEVENWTFLLFLLYSLILLHQKVLDKILCFISLWKLQVNENFNKLHLIIHQILTFRSL